MAIRVDRVRALTAQGLTQREIGRRLGVSRTTIRKCMVANGIVSTAKASPCSDEERAAIFDMRTAGMTHREIAEACGRSAGVVEQIVWRTRHDRG